MTANPVVQAPENGTSYSTGAQPLREEGDSLFKHYYVRCRQES